jgi:hypothetical protein
MNKIIIGIIIGLIIMFTALYFIPTNFNPIKNKNNYNETNHISITNTIVSNYISTNKITLSTTNIKVIQKDRYVDITNITYVDITNITTEYKNIENKTEIKGTKNNSGLYYGIGIIGDVPIGSITYQNNNVMFTGFIGFNKEIKFGGMVSIRF